MESGYRACRKPMRRNLTPVPQLLRGPCAALKFAAMSVIWIRAVETKKLVTMANAIGAFFEGESDRVRAEAGVADHLKRFWDPRMRRQILTWLDTHGGAGLSPLVAAAIARHRSQLAP